MPSGFAIEKEAVGAPPEKPVPILEKNLRLPYSYVAGDCRARYLRALKEKKILGSRCSKTGKVLVPPMITSPESFAPSRKTATATA